MGRGVRGYALGVTPREGNETGLGRWGEESSDAVLVGSWVDPTGICRIKWDRMTHQSCPE